MRTTARMLGGGVLVALLAPAAPMAQTSAADRRAELVRAIERRIEARQPLDVSADAITIEGDVLRLKGNVRIVIGPDTFVRTEEAAFDRAAKRVQLIGNVWASLGPSAGIALRNRNPRVEYR